MTSAHDHDHDHRDDHDHMVHHHRDVQGGTVRAAVFGISDGLVSNVALITGVAAADSGSSSVVVAGVAGLLAGAASMAAGEYVSVKAQSELIEHELERERVSIAEKPELETRELAAIYASRGIDRTKPSKMAEVVMSDPEVALEVHAREELGVDPTETGRPIAAALYSFARRDRCLYPAGALVVRRWVLDPHRLDRVGASRGGGRRVRPCALHRKSKVRTVARQVLLGSAACLLTWLIGSLVGASIT